ncbi:hypothetical protein FGF1_41290 [Flavobacteriaceae bacterium GF1]
MEVNLNTITQDFERKSSCNKIPKKIEKRKDRDSCIEFKKGSGISNGRGRRSWTIFISKGLGLHLGMSKVNGIGFYTQGLGPWHQLSFRGLIHKEGS